MDFIDTNVLVYAASNAADDAPKRTLARELLTGSAIAFSAQVLQEFYAAAVSKQRLQMTHEDAVAVFPVCPITRELVLEATALKQRFGIGYWDAAILAAAKLMDCTTVYSEDLNDGQVYDSVVVVNPFAELKTQ